MRRMAAEYYSRLAHAAVHRVFDVGHLIGRSIKSSSFKPQGTIQKSETDPLSRQLEGVTA